MVSTGGKVPRGRTEGVHYGLWPASADPPSRITGASKLADVVRTHLSSMEIAELYAGHARFDVAQRVADLVATESVPFLPVVRHTETG